jgi:nitronate monooxygenase
VRCDLAPLKRPKFLAIVSSHVLAATILKRANGKVNGFIRTNRETGRRGLC